VSETKEKKTARKNIVVALGIVCILLVACLGGSIATYTLTINDKNNTISLLNSKISQLNSTVANLISLFANLQNPLTTLWGALMNSLAYYLPWHFKKPTMASANL